MATFTLAALQSEINTDPKSRGYASHVTAKDRAGLLALINATYAGVGVVWRNDVRDTEVLAALPWSDVSAFTQNSWNALAELLKPAVIDATQANVRSWFVGIFPAQSTSLANLTALAQKASPSRAEELWGFQFAVTEQELADAGF